MDNFKLLVDFNDLEDGIVSGLQRYAEGPRELRLSDRVLVRDGDGNRCWGNVDRVEGELVYVSLEADTWMPVPERRTSTRKDSTTFS